MSTSFMNNNVKPSIGNDLTDLNHLFIILSHPDQDHINLINSETIPQGIPITVLSEGVFDKNPVKIENEKTCYSS